MGRRRWQRRYDLADLLTVGVMENPAEAGRTARALIRQMAFVGARDEVFKTLAVLREVLPDDWLKDDLTED